MEKTRRPPPKRGQSVHGQHQVALELSRRLLSQTFVPQAVNGDFVALLQQRADDLGLPVNSVFEHTESGTVPTPREQRADPFGQPGGWTGIEREGEGPSSRVTPENRREDTRFHSIP
ncbi:MAG: hypothetical protein A2W26_08600 [Acidobacteria bacterium RBG_16_64_8]|nr:MAG: hypothetical protein A2W26_08600 [Acidobacteria bacterium RBG_16_64_8]